MPDPADCDLDVLVVRLREWCERHQLRVDFLDRVDEATAAAILDCEPRTLRNDRTMGATVPYYRIGRRVYYHLGDLARRLAGERVEV